MSNEEILEYEWPYLLTFLPAEAELEQSAKAMGAMTRKRHITKAETLLRLAFAYGFCGMSLRQTAAWAEERNLASLSDVALLKRLRAAAPWFQFLLASKLAESARLPLVSRPASQVRIVDATCISRPGSTGTDWRVHLGMDLAHLTINHLDLTDSSGGETLRRFTFTPGEIVLADRGYAHRPGLEATIRAGADFLVRMPWQNVPLQQRSGAPFDLIATLRALDDARPADIPLALTPSSRNATPLHVRLLAARKSETAATQARQNVLDEARRRSRGLDPRTVETAGYVLLLTSAPSDVLSVREGMDLYRFRWQIELTFKRLKSLLHLDVLPAKDPALARSILSIKLLAAVLLDNLTQEFLCFSPWGYRLS
jgi:hypothetical protein